MRIGRAIIIPAVLALTTAGSIVAGSALSVATAQASTTHVQSVYYHATPSVYYHA
jgi:hypothetical protein